jgi:hypothetical protein
VKRTTGAAHAVAPWDACPAARPAGKLDHVTEAAHQEPDMYAKQITTRAAAPASQLDGAPDDWAVFPS